MYPTVLVIDADDKRSQQMGRLLTLTGYRPCLVTSPYDAFERVLHEGIFPQALFLSRPDLVTQPVMQRLLQRLFSRFSREIPLLLLPPEMPATVPLFADPSLQTFHRISQTSINVLEPLWKINSLSASSFRRSQQSLVLTALPKIGLHPRISREQRSRNSHFRRILQAAHESINNKQWNTLMTDVGLAHYASSENWPTDNDERMIPAASISYLNQAVAFSRPDDPEKQLRRWSEHATTLSLQERRPSALTQQVLKFLPVERVMSTILNAFTKEMNEIRGEELHQWKKQLDGTYWLVHYSNLYAYGRIAALQPACHVWLASLERTFHLVGLDTTWEVTELECSCQTLTGHCLFAIQPRNKASFH